MLFAGAPGSCFSFLTHVLGPGYWPRHLAQAFGPGFLAWILASWSMLLVQVLGPLSKFLALKVHFRKIVAQK